MQAKIESALAELRLTMALMDSARIRHLKAITQLEGLNERKPHKEVLSAQQKAKLLMKHHK